MSRENVQAVRRAFEVWNATGEPDFSIIHPDLVYHPRADEPDPSAHVGRDEYDHIEVQELIDAGDYVGVVGYVAGHGEASGLEFRMRLVNILELRDGMVFRAYDLSGVGEPY